MFLNKSLRLQIFSLVGTSLLLLLAIALISVLFLSADLQAYQRLLAGPVQDSTLINEANLEFKIQVQEWKNVLLRGQQPDGLHKYWGQFEQQEARVERILRQLDSQLATGNPLKPGISRLLAEHQQLGQAYRKGRADFLAAGADPRAGDLAVRGIDREATEQMSQLVSQILEQSRQQARDIDQTAGRTRLWTLGLLILCSLLLASASLWLINHQLIRPLQRVTRFIGRLGEGHFDQPLQLERQDELGQLAHSANTLCRVLDDTFQQLRQSISALDTASSGLNQIASGMSKGLQDQFERTDLVATAMNEMSATAQEVSGHAAQAAGAAGQADRSAREGGQVMQASIGTMRQIRSDITHMAEILKKLEQDSERIGSVIEVISSIADQTNLLALNAAIEAARAGEQGRGFAVVADEVRTLARRTAESTAEIQQIIEAVQDGARNAARAIERGQDSTEEGVTQITASGEVLQHITHAIESIRDMNQQIATAAEEQTAVAEDISRNLTHITDIAATNQNSVQQTEAASQQLHRQSEDLGNIMARLG